MLMFLAAEPATGLAAQTVVIYYVLGILVIVCGGITGGYRIYKRSKKRWTEEGETRAKQAQAIEENNEQLKSNTAAIGKLTIQLTEFVAKVAEDLDSFANRLERLEHFVHGRRDNNDSRT